MVDQLPAEVPSRAPERRRNPRFELHFPVFLRAFGEPWSLTESVDVGGAGALFVTDRPFLLNTPVEYVMTFPPELTKAPAPLRVRFYGSVLRCERTSSDSGTFRVAVRNSAHRYLAETEAATLVEMEHRQAPAAAVIDTNAIRPTGT